LTIARETGNRQAEGLALGNLGNVSVDLGDYSASMAYFQQYEEIASVLDNKHGRGHALSGLGDAAFELGNFAQAADYYLEADRLRVSIGQEHLAMESRAGRVRALMAQGEAADCYSLVESILRFMENSEALVGSEDLRIYLTCVQVLQANDDPRATTLLESAYKNLQEQATAIGDPATRRQYLENIPWHREIIAAWSAQQDKKP
jgi:tetratricopeptide (TPR) repeat protein